MGGENTNKLYKKLLLESIGQSRYLIKKNKGWYRAYELIRVLFFFYKEDYDIYNWW